MHAAGEAPRPSGRVVQLGCRCRSAYTACNQHFAIAQQCCCVTKAGMMHAAGETPCPCGRVVQLGCRYEVVVLVCASGNQHPAILESSCCLFSTRAMHVACGAPYSCTGRGLSISNS